MAKLTAEEIQQVQAVLNETELVVIALGIQPTHLLSKAWVEYFKTLSCLHESIVLLELMLSDCDRSVVAQSLRDLRKHIDQSRGLFEYHQG